MPGSAKRWKHLAEELASEREQIPPAPSVRKGRMARAKRRAAQQAAAEAPVAPEIPGTTDEHPAARRSRRR